MVNSTDLCNREVQAQSTGDNVNVLADDDLQSVISSLEAEFESRDEYNLITECDTNVGNMESLGSTMRADVTSSSGDQVNSEPSDTIHRFPGQVGPDIVSIHGAISGTGVPNFASAQIPVETKLNIQAWERRLKNYHDQEL